MKQPRKKRNYINNRDFYEALVKYKEQYVYAEKFSNSGKLPQMPDYLGECFMKLAYKIASRPNFSGYSYKEEMIEDGIENCMIAWKSFDPEKTQNPFAYFTQIIWYAFLRRIEKEQKQSYIKHKSLLNASLEATLLGTGEKIDTDASKLSSHYEKFEKRSNGKAT